MKVFGFQLILSTEEQGLWWDTDNHAAFESAPAGKPGWGIKIAFRGGDICHPHGVAERQPGDDQWKDNKWWNPKKVIRKRVRLPILPFIAVSFGERGFYLGFKDWPVHHENYLRWLDPKDVNPTSRALCLSASIRKTRMV